MSRREFLKGRWPSAPITVVLVGGLADRVERVGGRGGRPAGSLVARRAAESADRHGLWRFSRPRRLGARSGRRPLGRRHASRRLV